MNCQQAIYRWDPHNRLGDGALKFRLYYEGQLLSANGDTRARQTDRRADHKHEIRRAFHKQLKHLWNENKFLSRASTNGEALGLRASEKRPLHEAIAENMGELNGFKFVPLVCEKFDLLCKLDILMLRRDAPGGVIQSRDLDNRLKTLFDALKKPKDVSELGQGTPKAGENPLYVLLQEDNLITHVSVETDTLLDPPDEAGKDDSFVRLIVGVELQPYNANMFNLSFG